MADYGIINELINDDTVTEIMINSASQIYFERSGKLSRYDKQYASTADLYRLIDSILKPLGKEVSAVSPCADGRLEDGSRVNIVIPPAAVSDPMITIRKFSKHCLTADDLVSSGSLSRPMAGFLKLCVESRKNIIVSGGTGSGKTTLLNVLSSFIPADERIVTIEDTAELRLKQEHVGRLEARPADSAGNGAVSIRQLVINALRMRPDRIVVGECRGAEALDMLQAMNTGHDGSLTTIHANSPRDCLKRLEVMVLMAGYDLPVRAVREQIVSAVQLVVQVARLADGTRKVTRIDEITGMEGDIITMLPVFAFQQSEGDRPREKIPGVHCATQNIPTFIETLRAAGKEIDMALFE